MASNQSKLAPDQHFFVAEHTLASIDNMRQDSEWAQVMAAMPEGSWCPDPQELDRFHGRLVDMCTKLESKPMTNQRFIPKGMVKRLQDCLLPLQVTVIAQ